MKCVNIDWLEVYVLENPDLWPMNAEHFRKRGYEVEERPYGTRSYKEMFTLRDTTGMPMIEVRRAPIGMFDNGEQNHSYEFYGARLRFVNRYCYYEGAAELMQRFILTESYQFSRIAKIDICLDFIKFDSGDLPQRFISRYVNGKYSKINQSNITAYGKDTWAGRGWSSLSWGSKKSPVFTRLYCKSIELEEQKDKPYIRQAWAAAGLVANPVTCEAYDENGELYKPLIWRLEFSISSSVKRWVTIDDEITPGLKKRSFKNTLDVYFTRDGIYRMIASLCNHYFHFRYYQEGVSKYKCEQKVLFHFSDVTEFYKIEKVATDVEASTLVKRLKKLLQMFNLTHYDQEANHTASVLLSELEQFELKNMAVDPWNTDEVELLRQLLRIRLERKEMPFEEAKREAAHLVEIERSIWDNIGSDNKAVQ